mgnify:CR=1 FL=1
MNDPANKILIYTFYNWNKKSYKFLRTAELPGCNKIYIRNVQEAHRLAKHITLSNYTIVLGIADHNKNAKKHRVETTFQNRYGKSEIVKDGRDVYVPTLIIQPSESLYYAKSSTNGPCNRSGYLIAKTIEEKKLKTRFGFVHVNKNLPEKELKNDIQSFIAKGKV